MWAPPEGETMDRGSAPTLGSKCRDPPGRRGEARAVGPGAVRGGHGQGGGGRGSGRRRARAVAAPRLVLRRRRRVRHSEGCCCGATCRI